jgi:hypothetical protein
VRASVGREDLLWRAFFENAAAVEEAHLACHLAREAHLVRRDDHRHPDR